MAVAYEYADGDGDADWQGVGKGLQQSNLPKPTLIKLLKVWRLL